MSQIDRTFSIKLMSEVATKNNPTSSYDYYDDYFYE